MKTILSFATLFACAITGTTLSAENANTPPVIVHNSYNEIIAEAESLNAISAYLNGTQGNKVTLNSNVTITSPIIINGNADWALISGSESTCEISGVNSGQNRIFQVNSSTLKVFLENISFSNIEKNYIFYFNSNGHLTLGGVGSFQNIRKTCAIVLGDATLLSGSNIAITDCTGYIGNPCALISGNLTLEDNSSVTFDGNIRATESTTYQTWCVKGNLTIGKKSSVSLSNNDDGISGKVNIYENGNLSITSCNKGVGVGGGLIAQNNTTLYFQENSARAIIGDVAIGEKSTANFIKNIRSTYNTDTELVSLGGAVYGNIILGDFTNAAFSENSNTNEGFGSISSHGGAVYGDIQTGEGLILTFAKNNAFAKAQGRYNPDGREGSYASGGAIYGDLQIGEKNDVVFLENSATAITTPNRYAARAYGGAICGNVQVGKNATVVFSKNSTSASSQVDSYATGGAVSGDITIAEEAKVTFENNKTSSTTDDKTSKSRGGAVYGNIHISERATVIFSGNTSSVMAEENGADITSSGGAVHGNVQSSENSTIVFYQNAAMYGGATFSESGTSNFAGNIQFLNNTASLKGGAIYSTSSLVFSGSTTTIVFSGNKTGSEASGWSNNDIALGNSKGSITIMDSGRYTFGGGIDASAGGVIDISEAHLTFQESSINKFGGNTTISNSATISLKEGATFEIQAGANMSFESKANLELCTNLDESTVIEIEKDASISFDETVKIIIDVYLPSQNDSFLSDGSSNIAIIRAHDQNGIDQLGEIEVRVNGETFNGEWITFQEANTLYLGITIPEPSTFGLLSGLGALTLCASRRNRRR